MEGIEAQVDCATRIARHKLIMKINQFSIKIGLPFHNRSCTRIKI
jgi:hypothetical protein